MLKRESSDIFDCIKRVEKTVLNARFNASI